MGSWGLELTDQNVQKRKWLPSNVNAVGVAHNSRCEGKVAYRRGALADSAAMRMSAKTGDLLVSYQCCDCGRWHVGHADWAQIRLRIQSAPPRCVVCGTLISKERLAQAQRSRTPIHACSKLCRGLYKTSRQRERRRAAEGLADFSAEMAFEFCIRYLPWLPPDEGVWYEDAILKTVLIQGSAEDVKRLLAVAGKELPARVKVRHRLLEGSLLSTRIVSQAR